MMGPAHPLSAQLIDPRLVACHHALNPFGGRISRSESRRWWAPSSGGTTC
jgi:hypothetical protein